MQGSQTLTNALGLVRARGGKSRVGGVLSGDSSRGSAFMEYVREQMGCGCITFLCVHPGWLLEVTRAMRSR